MIALLFFTLACTSSMEPTFVCGDIVNGYALQDWQKPQIGFVYIYEFNSSLNIIHRLVNETQEGYIFKGDNLNRTDRIVQRSQIKYKILSKTNTSGGTELI